MQAKVNALIEDVRAANVELAATDRPAALAAAVKSIGTGVLAIVDADAPDLITWRERYSAAVSALGRSPRVKPGTAWATVAQRVALELDEMKFQRERRRRAGASGFGDVDADPNGGFPF